MAKKKVIIVGAGPGGLTAGMILANKGIDVQIFEKEKIPGGRNGHIDLKGFRFDIGPTFLMMRYILDEVFSEVGLKSSDYLKFTKLSPMYRLIYPDNYMDVYSEHDKMKKELTRVFPGDAEGFDRFLKKEEKRFKKLMPCLQKDYSYWHRFLRWVFIRAIPSFSLGSSLYGVLNRYFKHPNCVLSFTFQSKYLGMNPWNCPGAFGMIPYVEHSMGIYHVEGGLSEISTQMARVVKEKGGKISYGSAVKQVLFDGNKATGVLLSDGRNVMADAVVINADFSYAMNRLVPEGKVKRYTPAKVAKKKFSCSIFMLYLGLDRQYKELKHHTIVFSKEYKEYLRKVFKGEYPGSDISFYVRNASILDKKVAPKGKSQFYILVPVPNKQVGKIDWKKKKAEMRRFIMDGLKDRLGIQDVEKHIICEKIITPDEWISDYNVWFGATFNLAHSLDQMLYFRPHNKLDGCENCYVVGGGTHPGSGLPTIYESGRITARMIAEHLSSR